MGIKFNKFITNIGIYVSIILFSGINKYNLKQTHPKKKFGDFFPNFKIMLEVLRCIPQITFILCYVYKKYIEFLFD